MGIDDGSKLLTISRKSSILENWLAAKCVSLTKADSKYKFVKLKDSMAYFTRFNFAAANQILYTRLDVAV